MSHLRKLGTVRKVNAETGEVVETKQNAMSLLPPPGDKCQICAVDHAWDQPHNQQSLYYQMRFYSEHGRWPTWTDAMAHCTEEVKKVWREQLIKLMGEKGIPIPDDLRGKRPCPR